MKRNSSFRDRLASADPDESSGAQPAPQASQKLSTKQDMRSNVALREGWMHKLPVRDKHAISGFRRRYLRLMPPDQLEWWVEEPTPTADPKGILDVTEKTTVQVREIAKSDCAKGGGSQKEATIQTGDLKLVIRAAPPPGKPSNDEEELNPPTNEQDIDTTPDKRPRRHPEKAEVHKAEATIDPHIPPPTITKEQKAQGELATCDRRTNTNGAPG